MNRRTVALIAIVFLASGAVFSLAFAQGKPSEPESVAKILARSCALSGCHQGRYPAQNLSFEPGRVLPSALNSPSVENATLKIIDTDVPGKSYLLMKIKGEKGIAAGRMPLNAQPLTEAEIATIQDWIVSLKGQGLHQAPDPAAAPKKKAPAPAFWGVRLINLPTTQTVDKHRFLFQISHRYTNGVGSGYDTFYGINGPARIMIATGYGITDRLGVWVKHANQTHEFELGLGWLLFDQGDRLGMPFSASVYVGGGLVTESRPGLNLFAAENLKFTAQLSLAHQFGRRFSVLLVPCFATNTTDGLPTIEGSFALGFGGRFEILQGFSVIGEWLPVLAGHRAEANGWGFGLEDKIGGHVFQVFLTNSLGITSDRFIPGGDLRKGVRIGFNIFRTF
jgi:hypothetical protein